MSAVKTNIYTIGYQSRSIDDFIGILRKKDLNYVIDIRHTPLSYKPGFSKGWLSKHLPEHGINYISIPQLGIPRNYRKRLNPKKLWAKYRELLEDRSTQVDEIIDICKTHSSVLMCFELDPHQCHRHVLANRLNKKTGLQIIHL